MWAKFFLLILIEQIPPQFSNISLKMSSVMFSGKPPTNIVRQPGGRSLLDGGGASESNVTVFYILLTFPKKSDTGIIYKLELE